MKEQNRIALGIAAAVVLTAGCGDDGGGDTAPAITVHPTSQTVTEGQAATFTVTATGSGTLTYQWKKDGADVTDGTGGTTASYTTPATVLADSGAQFTCVVMNAAGNVESNAATLTVNPPPPEITAHPSDQTVTEDETAAFSVTATGTGPLTYQWKKDGMDIGGATLSSYTTAPTVLADDGAQFTCTVANLGGSVESNPATLTVNMAPPQITVHPWDRTVTEGQTAAFSVTATGSGTLQYQWKKDGVDIGGATSSSYTTPATVLADDGAQFTCTVTNLGGSVESNPATLTVDMAPPQIAAHPLDQMVIEGDTATFIVTATGSATLQYQWKKDGVDIGGATSSSYTTPATVLADDGAQFTCVVTNPVGSVESNAATLTVYPTGNDYRIIDLTTGAFLDVGGVPDLETNDAYKTTRLVLKRIPAGSFQMGAAVASDEFPVHTVNITQDLYMGVFEVTQRQWYEVQGYWRGIFITDRDKRPVEMAAWFEIGDASGFMDTLSSLASLSARLPTEAEWEYCCKAGTSTNFSYGDTEDGDWMWYGSNSGGQTHEVATTTSKPNPWGLYDVHGNVAEWCGDWYDDGYYAVSPTDDPQGPGSSPYGVRVVRGGWWGGGVFDCRSARRLYADPTGFSGAVGFRVAAAP